MARTATKLKKSSARTLTKGGATRERIREAVIRLVSRHGINNVILQDICDEAEITHGGFYFHFARKEDAMLDVAQEWIKQFKTKIIATPPLDDFYDEIHAMILTYVTGYNEKIEVTRLVYALDPTYEEIRHTFTVYQRRWWDRLHDLFVRVRREAGLPTGMELSMVHTLTAGLEGLSIDTYLSRLPELVAITKQPAQFAERMAVIWHRTVLGADPSAAKIRYVRDEIAAQA